MTTVFRADVEALVRTLKTTLPHDVVERLFRAYIEIKHQFILGKHQPSELHGGHLAEVMLRLLEHMRGLTLTPFGITPNAGTILGEFGKDTAQPEAFRKIVTKLIPILMDIRNTRGVAHPAGEINPNPSDAIFVVHSANWLMTEVIRHFYVCTLAEARSLVSNINQVKVPAVFDYGGSLKILNTSLNFREKTLLALYYKHGSPVTEQQLMQWLKYSALAAYRKNILAVLDADALIYREGQQMVLTPKGIREVEANIPLDIEA